MNIINIKTAWNLTQLETKVGHLKKKKKKKKEKKSGASVIICSVSNL